MRWLAELWSCANAPQRAALIAGALLTLVGLFGLSGGLWIAFATAWVVLVYLLFVKE